jgi:prophage regulatory protein
MTEKFDTFGNGSDDLSEHVLLTRKQVLALVPYSIAHIYRLEGAGLFPPRIKVGQRRVAWRRGQVLAWLRSRPQAPSPSRSDDT